MDKRGVARQDLHLELFLEIPSVCFIVSWLQVDVRYAMIHRLRHSRSPTYVFRRLLDLLASNASSLLSSTLFKKSTFSRYPPPRLLASSSSLRSLDCEATCARHSIADLSSVVIFLACDALGITGSAVRDFRGPGRFAPNVGVVVASSGAGPGLGSAGGGTALSHVPSSVSPLSRQVVGMASDVGRGGDDKRGHFFASSESSGTSTTSLNKAKRACDKCGNVREPPRSQRYNDETTTEKRQFEENRGQTRT